MNPTLCSSVAFCDEIAVSSQAASTQEDVTEEDKARDEMAVHGVLDRRLLVLQSASSKDISGGIKPQSLNP